MEYVKQWSWPTLALYVGLAVLIAFLFRQAIISKNKDKNIKILKLKINTKYIYYALIFIIFVIFSGFRFYNYEIGGTDTVVYEGIFLETTTFFPFSIKSVITLDDSEFLYYNFMALIKLIGGNFFTFSIIIYSLIILAYIAFIDRVVCDEKKWFWLILVFLPLLKSFNIIRNCFTAAIGYIAIEVLNKKKYITFIILSIIAFLNHYIMLILFAFGIFCLIIPEKWITNRKILICLNIACIVLIFAILPTIKDVISRSGFDAYVNKKVEISLLGYIPIILAYILMILDKNIVNYFKEINHFIYYRTMVFISFTLPIFIMVGGASRLLLLFELPRYIVYSDLYSFYRNKIPSKIKTLYDIACIGGVMVWLVFRIWRMWYTYSLMPYYNILFM